MLKEFRDFIARGNVVDLAVGIIIGAAFTAIVNSLVTDLLNPVIGLLTGGTDFSGHYLVLKGEVPAGASLKVARDSGAAVLAWGAFLSSVINFLIVAWAVFLLVKGVNRVQATAFGNKAPEAPKGPSAEELLAQIRDELRARHA